MRYRKKSADCTLRPLVLPCILEFNLFRVITCAYINKLAVVCGDSSGLGSGNNKIMFFRSLFMLTYRSLSSGGKRASVKQMVVVIHTVYVKFYVYTSVMCKPRRNQRGGYLCPISLNRITEEAGGRLCTD